MLGVREELRGAEAITDTPCKGDNVSTLSAKKFYNSVENTFLAPTREIHFFFCFFFFLGSIGGSVHSECWRTGVSAVPYPRAASGLGRGIHTGMFGGVRLQF